MKLKDKFACSFSWFEILAIIVLIYCFVIVSAEFFVPIFLVYFGG